VLDVNHIASGSTGNAIVIDDGFSSILLDCGISYRTLAWHTRVDLLSGCIITHEHADHCKAWKDLALRGVELYASNGTKAQLFTRERAGVSLFVIYTLRKQRIGTFDVERFDVQHDAEEPIAVMLTSRKTNARALYITDTASIDFSPSDVTHLIVECNHHELALEQMTNDFLRERVKNSHLSLEKLLSWLDTFDKSKLREIHLVHLSDVNSDEKLFVRLVQQKTAIPTYSISYKKP
jgi:phosphoribosyl 1,2-cyclic phosphodiesterase